MQRLLAYTIIFSSVSLFGMEQKGINSAKQPSKLNTKKEFDENKRPHKKIKTGKPKNLNNKHIYMTIPDKEMYLTITDSNKDL